MSEHQAIGLIFIEGWADWEFGLISSAAEEWLGCGRVVSLSPNGGAVRSIGGLALTPERRVDAEAAAELDAVAVVGSDGWAGGPAPEVEALLAAVAARGGVVGGICAGTLPLARAGLFASARHTSNGRAWIAEQVPGYAGAGHYQDVPHAVADGNVVSAPGTAPGTFALAFLGAVFPGKAAKLAGMREMFAKEYQPA